jgi:hypothetical protein
VWSLPGLRDFWVTFGRDFCFYGLTYIIMQSVDLAFAFTRLLAVNPKLALWKRVLISGLITITVVSWTPW